MFVPLADVLQDHLFRSAEPMLLAGAARVPETQVRWIHPSELLQISALLHGDELLLTTGEALLRQRPEAQLAYLQSLSERGVAALVIEPVSTEVEISPEFIDRAEQLGLPLYRLRATVPFVELAEKINRQIVSEHAATLQQADEISQKLARHIASAGPNLAPLMEMIANALSVRAMMLDLAGEVIADSQRTAGPLPEGTRPLVVSADLFVGADVAARLVLHGDPQTQREHLELIADRLGSIVGLAFAQHYRPTVLQVANTALLQSIVNGAGGNFIAERARDAQIPEGHPLCLLVFQSFDMSRMRAVLERILHARFPAIRTYLESHRLYALVVLDESSARDARSKLVEQLRQALAGVSVECCVGPVARDILHAPWSLAEALALESFPSLPHEKGRVRDAADYALERLLADYPSGSGLEEFVEEQIGSLRAADRQKRSSLVATLCVWLDSGCNTTLTATRLYLERQTLHKRLAKIFALIGGDPRETDRILSIHLACRMAMGLQHR